jgi:hypothetical protein
MVSAIPQLSLAESTKSAFDIETVPPAVVNLLLIFLTDSKGLMVSKTVTFAVQVVALPRPSLTVMPTGTLKPTLRQSNIVLSAANVRGKLLHSSLDPLLNTAALLIVAVPWLLIKIETFLT